MTQTCTSQDHGKKGDHPEINPRIPLLYTTPHVLTDLSDKSGTGGSSLGLRKGGSAEPSERSNSPEPNWTICNPEKCVNKSQ